MATRYIENVAKLCHVQVSDLGIDGHYEIPAQCRIVKDFILQKVLFVGGEMRRQRISDEFMLFMAEWGQECIARDAETGTILMEIALQRISKGAAPHADYDLLNALPLDYQWYCAVNDEPGEMTAACWEFLRKNLSYCLEDLQNETWQRHAELITLGLLCVLNEDGSTNDGYRWNEQAIGTSAKDAYDVLLNIASIMLSFYEIVPTLAPTWRKKRRYFKMAETVVDWSSPEISSAFKNDAAVDKQGNPYFNRRSKFFLKLFGLYQFALIVKIRQDMRTLPQ